MQNSDIDINLLAKAIAPILIKEVQETHHDFWIDRETHYNDHRDWRDFKDAIGTEETMTLKDLIAMYRLTRRFFLKAFIGFAIVGCLVFAAVGMGFKH